jgi:tRNA-binding EMAP/Myf-like protein
MIDQIDFEDWKKIEMKVDKIIQVEKIPNRDKLYLLLVDVGEPKPRQIISGLVPYYSKDELIEKKLLF